MRGFFLGFFLIVVFALEGFGQVILNEICPSNADIIYDPDRFNFGGWVELYNNSDEEVVLGGYYLSDDAGQLQKWMFPPDATIPANGYLLVWCDETDEGLHTNFSMREKGGSLFLSGPSGNVVDQVDFPVQYTNTSYGRAEQDNQSWTYHAQPTPNSANVGSDGGARLNKVQSSLLPGRYGSQLAIKLSVQGGGAIRYTTDGSEPTLASARYIKPVTLNRTATIKAKAFLEGFIPGETAVFTYFINEHLFTLPVISLTTSPDYLWDEQIGIYADGENGIVGGCFPHPVNWYRDWDRHVYFEVFSPGGIKLFEQAGDLRISGGCSRTFPQKPFALKARNKYGDNEFKHTFFPTNINREYGGLFIRNSGNDQSLTMFRDALLQSLVVGQMDVDYQAYQPAALYLNGQYWGIQNLREKIDADYLKTNYDLDKEEIDLLELNAVPMEGTADAYLAYLDGLGERNMEDASAFDYINRNIDVQEYINYMVTQIYVANRDWPGNNIKFWRERAEGGKFRWVLLDLDFGFDLNKGIPAESTHPTLDFATEANNTEWPNPAWSTFHFRKLLENPVFREKFVRTMNTAIDVTFSPERVISYIDSLQRNIQGEIYYHKARWGGDMTEWHKEVQLLRDFAVSRNVFMKKHVAEFFGLTGGRADVSVKVNPVGHGSFTWNQLHSTEAVINKSYPKGLPYRLEAVPDYQEIFQEWKVTTWNSTESVLIRKGSAWNYFDSGHSPGEGWQSLDFPVQNWKSGLAEFGYGDDDERTVIDYGPDDSKKHTTAYFRQAFYLDNPDSISHLKASILYDDGVVVYLNGQEVYRENLPDGSVEFSTYSNRAKYAEEVFLDVRIGSESLLQEKNVIAVEVHQVSDVSSDLSFDLEMKSVHDHDEKVTYISDAVVEGFIDNNMSFEAYFELPAVNQRVVINELSATKSKKAVDDFGEREDWIELFNPSNREIDLEGFYITDNLLNKQKHKLEGQPGSLTIAPGAYMILWADDHTHQGSRHLSFKLSSSGEDVGLYEMVNGELITHDELVYGKLPDGFSFARIPNASGPLTVTSNMTPGKNNLLDAGEDASILVYPNPTESYLHIESTKEIEKIALYDFAGNIVGQFVPQDSSPVNLYHLKSGLYILQIFLRDETRKFKVMKF